MKGTHGSVLTWKLNDIEQMCVMCSFKKMLGVCSISVLSPPLPQYCNKYPKRSLMFLKITILKLILHFVIMKGQLLGNEYL